MQGVYRLMATIHPPLGDVQSVEYFFQGNPSVMSVLYMGRNMPTDPIGLDGEIPEPIRTSHLWIVPVLEFFGSGAGADEFLLDCDMMKAISDITAHASSISGMWLDRGVRRMPEVGAYVGNWVSRHGI